MASVGNGINAAITSNTIGSVVLRGVIWIAVAIAGVYLLFEGRLDVIEKSLARIEGNRFTSEDGMHVQAQIAALQVQLASVPSEIPPSWFREEVKGIERRLDSVDNRLRTIEQKVVNGP